jgi:hypothetical protein
MASTPTDHSSDESVVDQESPVRDDYASSVPPLQRPDRAHPRLIEEHDAVGPHGESELEATDELGRRWYHLRPTPRRRYDLIGFNYTWWLIWLLVIFVIFLPWGRGWGY